MGGGNPIKSITNTVKNVVKNPISLLNPTAAIATGSVTGIPGVGQVDAGGGLLGQISGQAATMDALAAQRQGMESANAALAGTYGAQQGYLNPYAQAGGNALSSLSKGDFVNAETLAKDPGYQFRLNEGMKGINANAAAKGMLNSGATLKALQRYGQDYASSEYDKAYNRQYQNLSNLAGMGQNAANNLSSAAGSYGSNLANNYMGLGNATAAAQMQNHQNMMGLVNTGLSAAAMFSDERLKTNITPINKADFEEMKKTLKPYVFEYLNDEHGQGEWVGVMAQDLEKSKLGRTVVETDAQGRKIVNLKKLNSMILASIAEGA